MNVRGRVIEGLLLVMLVAVVTRVAWALLRPLFLPLLTAVLLIGVLSWIVRGPHAGR